MPGGQNYLGGGQSFVQAGNNTGGGFNRLAFFGVGAMQMKMGHMMRRDLISAQGEEQRKTLSHKTDEGFRADIGKGFISRQHLTSDYDTIFAKDEKGNYTRPEMADHFKLGGFERNAHGIQPGAISGIKIADINAGNRDQQAEDRETRAAEKEKNKQEKDQPKPKFDPNDPNNGFKGYTPRKTGTGGYDEALKEGKIDQDTYDSYLEDSKEKGKDYMPKQASTAIDTLVKERDSRKDTFDTGTNEHRTNVSTAWGEGKITTDEAADLSTPGSEQQKTYNVNSFPNLNTDEEIQKTHANAGLDDKKGTQY
jgi:hypothetical protein